jgi:hypothetical protein
MTTKHKQSVNILKTYNWNLEGPKSATKFTVDLQSNLLHYRLESFLIVKCFGEHTLRRDFQF